MCHVGKGTGENLQFTSIKGEIEHAAVNLYSEYFQKNMLSPGLVFKVGQKGPLGFIHFHMFYITHHMFAVYVLLFLLFFWITCQMCKASLW